jgi:hypothetical protein
VCHPGARKLFANAAVKRRGIAVLEISTAAAVDQQRVTREYAAIDPVTQVIVAMSRCVDGLQANAADFYRVSFFHRDIGGRHSARCRIGSDELFARMKQHWSEGQIVEITALVSYFGFS